MYVHAQRSPEPSWWFGPAIVKKTVPLSTVVSAEPATTSIFNSVAHIIMRSR